jgi:hypothetical protein
MPPAVMAWLVVVALSVFLMWLGRPPKVPAGRRGDTHGLAVAEFGRELGDWDRDGRP